MDNEYNNAPHRHAEVTLTNVQVPLSAMVLGEGKGFEIIQGSSDPVAYITPYVLWDRYADLHLHTLKRR